MTPSHSLPRPTSTHDTFPFRITDRKLYFLLLRAPVIIIDFSKFFFLPSSSIEEAQKIKTPMNE